LGCVFRCFVVAAQATWWNQSPADSKRSSNEPQFSPRNLTICLIGHNITHNRVERSPQPLASKTVWNCLLRIIQCPWDSVNEKVHDKYSHASCTTVWEVSDTQKVFSVSNQPLTSWTNKPHFIRFQLSFIPFTGLAKISQWAYSPSSHYFITPAPAERNVLRFLFTSEV
jgi:hypothetical protein